MEIMTTTPWRLSLDPDIGAIFIIDQNRIELLATSFFKRFLEEQLEILRDCVAVWAYSGAKIFS